MLFVGQVLAWVDRSRVQPGKNWPIKRIEIKTSQEVPIFLLPMFHLHEYFRQKFSFIALLL